MNIRLASAAADTVMTGDDAREYDRRLRRLRELMQEHGFHGFIANDLGGLDLMSLYLGRWDEPVRYLSNFRLYPFVPITVVVPLEGEPALIMKPGFNWTFVREAKRQSWIRNIVALDVGTDVRALEHNDARPETAASIATVLKQNDIDRGRIALLGEWPGAAELKELLPNTPFESIPGDWRAGGPFGGLFNCGLSEWQISRYEEAIDAGQAAIQAYIAAARRDLTIPDATREGKAAAFAAGAETILLHGTISAEPWGYWNLDIAAPGQRFKAGHMYFIQVASATVKGHMVQIARSFTFGEPTPVQRHLMDTMRCAHQTLVAELEVGKTGKEIWEVVNGMVKREGLAEWSQYGHSGSMAGPPISFSAIAGDMVDGVVSEGQAYVLHPTLFDAGSGEYGMTGDCVVVKNGKVRNLAREPLPHDLL